MLCTKFELIPIKIGFFMNFQSYSKIRPKTLYYSTGSLAKFRQKWLGKNSLFLSHFLIHIHVLTLCRKFELILINIGFFIIFKNCSKDCLVVNPELHVHVHINRYYMYMYILTDTTCTFVFTLVTLFLSQPVTLRRGSSSP